MARRFGREGYTPALVSQFGGGVASLDPDEIAGTAWDLYTERDRAEATFSVLGLVESG
jgi:hypothetical protein